MARFLFSLVPYGRGDRKRRWAVRMATRCVSPMWADHILAVTSGADELSILINHNLTCFPTFTHTHTLVIISHWLPDDLTDHHDFPRQKKKGNAYLFFSSERGTHQIFESFMRHSLDPDLSLLNRGFFFPLQMARTFYFMDSHSYFYSRTER